MKYLFEYWHRVVRVVTTFCSGTATNTLFWLQECRTARYGAWYAGPNCCGGARGCWPYHLVRVASTPLFP